MFKEILKDIDFDSEDIVVYSMILLMFGGVFVYMIGKGLVLYPIIIGSAITTTVLFAIVAWSLKRYFEIKEMAVKPDSKEILARKYADDEITETELEEKTEKILE